jgi:nitrate reductase delta subunit
MVETFKAKTFEAKTFKALSALLSYPDVALQAAADEIVAVIRDEKLIDARVCRQLEDFAHTLVSTDLLELQESYVDLFDKSRRLSLHLFEHVHGESRDRGQAMVDLAALYEKGGLMLTASELPDYLPLFLEYLSTRPLAEARGVLADALHIVTALQERLAGRHAGYAAVLAAIRSAAGDRAALQPGGDAIAPEAENDLAALDAAWEETVVTFGPGEQLDGCSVDRLRIQMRAGSRDVRRARA